GGGGAVGGGGGGGRARPSRPAGGEAVGRLYRAPAGAAGGGVGAAELCAGAAADVYGTGGVCAGGGAAPDAQWQGRSPGFARAGTLAERARGRRRGAAYAHRGAPGRPLGGEPGRGAAQH